MSTAIEGMDEVESTAIESVDEVESTVTEGSDATSVGRTTGGGMAGSREDRRQDSQQPAEATSGKTGSGTTGS